MFRFALLSVALLAAPTAAEEPVSIPGARVELPLGEYDRLRQGIERPSLTVVDTLRVSGTFRGGDLRVTFDGRAAGHMPSEEVLRGGDGLALFRCDGAAIVSRAAEGFRLTPLASRFTASCRLATRGTDRVELLALGSVLWIESAVADGELVLGPAQQDGARSFTVVRRMAADVEGLAPTATARYRLTLRPDDARFRYHIEVRNPNRSRTPFVLTLAAGEHVQQVDAAAPYEAAGGRYRFDLPPGDSTIGLSGSFPGTSFAPPLDASLQYLLIEAHPLLRPAVRGDLRRISPQEVIGESAGFRGAQAFLLKGREKVEWSVTRLEAKASAGVAVNQASHIFFVSGDGWMRAESRFTLDNQGASGLTLPMAAEPTYVSLNGEDLYLTSDPGDPGKDLWVPMGVGAQELVVQHGRRFRQGLGLGLASLHVPRLPAPATQAQFEVRYPAQWYPLAWSFLGHWEVAAPGAGTAFGWVLLFVWTERVLAFLRLRTRQRLILAALLVTPAVAWGGLALVLVLADLAVSVLYAATSVRRWQWQPASIVAALSGVGVLALVVMAISVPSLRRSRTASFSSGDYDVSRPSAEKVAPSRAKSEAEAAGGATYQGLPAKMVLPPGARQATFEREMLAPDLTRVGLVLMASQVIVWWATAVLALVALVLLWRARRALADGWRARVEEWRTASRAVAEPGGSRG